jgi:phenylpropionate dioxygenase-like ring-hydroxylating dioxygenase large terminal subunit
MHGTSRWFPVIRSEEIVPRHIAFVQLLDEEIVLWRADDGALNAWENRCPHRGARLSIGTHAGSEIVCRYHGWRFASGSGSCTLIPAHPSQVPPKAARVRSYQIRERYGFAWIALGDVEGEPSLPELDGLPHLTLRSMTFAAAAADVAATLASEPGIVVHDPYRAVWERMGDAAPMLLLLQPESSAMTTLHAVAGNDLTGAGRLAFLRAHNAWCKEIRPRIVSEESRSAQASR